MPAPPATPAADDLERLIAPLRGWVDRTETRHDWLSPTPMAALAATLDQDAPIPQIGTPLPPLWHWLYFLPLHRQSELGPDGHARRGGFLPPVPLPRRMWAGGRLRFHQALRIGEPVSRTSRIADVSAKRGRGGPLVFVRVIHEIATAAGLALSEEHDIVYRELPGAEEPVPPPRAAPDDPGWSRTIRPDPVLLFRYSALTFNGHRIHYDRSYVTEVEGYPGLVVHGPLIATLLLDLLRRERPAARVAGFEFRALRPLFDTAEFSIHGRPEGRAVQLWARDAAGALAMDATATLEDP